MAKAEKYVIPAMPLTAALGELEGITPKKGVPISFDKTGLYPVINFTSAGGASVSISYTPATTRDPQESEGTEPVPVPASFTATVDGVAFSTADKHCPGKVKTAIRRSVNFAQRAVKKANGIVERSAARIARDDAKAAAKVVLAKL